MNKLWLKLLNAEVQDKFGRKKKVDESSKIILDHFWIL